MLAIRMIVGMIFELFVFPFLLGESYLSLVGKQRKRGSIVYGYCIMFSLFYVAILPCIYLKVAFRTASIVWLVETIVITLFTLIIKRDWFSVIKEKVIYVKNNTKIGKSIVIMLWCVIAIFSILFVIPQYTDEAILDSLTTWKTNYMYLFDPYTLDAYSELPITANAPIAMFYAVISKICAKSPLIICKYIVPIVLIFICFIVYNLLALKLFKHSKQRYVFLCVVIFNYFGILFFKNQIGMSILQNTWCGATILFNIIIPFSLYAYMECLEALEENNNKKMQFCIGNIIILFFSAKLLSVNGSFYVVTIIFICGLGGLIKWRLKNASDREFNNNHSND